MVKHNRPTFDGLPPMDKESEQALLGAIISQPRRLFDVRPLLDEGEVFYDLLLGDLYRIMLMVADAGHELRPLTVIQRINAMGRKDITDHVSIQSLLNEGVGCDVTLTSLHLRELYIKRIAIKESSELIRLVQDNEPFDAILDKARSLNVAITGKTNITSVRSMAKVASSAFDRIVAASQAKHGLSGIPTGSEQINRITGGWQNSDVIIPAGRPGSGKTVVLLHHAKHAAIAGKPTSFFSLEIDAEQCTTRLISSECLIPYSDLIKGRHQSGKLFSEDDWKRIAIARDYIASLPLYFYEGGSTDVNDLAYAAYDFQQKYGTELAVFDYLQKMSDRTVRGKAYDVVSSISGKIKDINLRTKRPVLAGSQLSRAVEAETRKNKRPQLDDLRESGKIEEDGSIVAGLYRDDYYKLKRAKLEVAQGRPFVLPEYDLKLEYDLLKNRNGPPGMIPLWIDVMTNRVADKDPALLGIKPIDPMIHKEPGAEGWVHKFPDQAAISFAEPLHNQQNGRDPSDFPF